MGIDYFYYDMFYIIIFILWFISVIMLIVAIVFIMFALKHPEKSFHCPFRLIYGLEHTLLHFCETPRSADLCNFQFCPIIFLLHDLHI